LKIFNHIIFITYLLYFINVVHSCRVHRKRNGRRSVQSLKLLVYRHREWVYVWNIYSASSLTARNSFYASIVILSLIWSAYFFNFVVWISVWHFIFFFLKFPYEFSFVTLLQVLLFLIWFIYFCLGVKICPFLNNNLFLWHFCVNI
jgi:hypothetical protein